MQEFLITLRLTVNYSEEIPVAKLREAFEAELVKPNEKLGKMIVEGVERIGGQVIHKTV